MDEPDMEPMEADVNCPEALKKQFLRSGLYSADYKLSPSDAKHKQSRTGPTKHSKHRLCAPQSILPLPLHFGDYWINSERDFYLTYDVVYQYENNLLHPLKEPPPFTKIKSSKLLNVVP
jgi:hypothetical protein